MEKGKDSYIIPINQIQQTGSCDGLEKISPVSHNGRHVSHISPSVLSQPALTAMMIMTWIPPKFPWVQEKDNFY